MLKFIVMSDLHLGPEGEVVNGLDTGHRLSLAVDSVNTEHPDADFVILAGDLTDKGTEAEYAHLLKVLEPLRVPVHIAIGNHDDRPAFLEAVPHAVTDGNGFVQFVIDAKGYRLIVLDSTEPGRHDGVLCGERLAWLGDRLAEVPDTPVIVVLHHHANPLFMPVDRIRLVDADAFADTLNSHADIRMVIAGHVHRETAGFWRGIPFATLSGNHYDVSSYNPGEPGRQISWDGPGQYALVRADEDGVLVHFHDYLNRHVEMPDGLFPYRKKRKPDDAMAA